MVNDIISFRFLSLPLQNDQLFEREREVIYISGKICKIMRWQRASIYSTIIAVVLISRLLKYKRGKQKETAGLNRLQIFVFLSVNFDAKRATTTQHAELSGQFTISSRAHSLCRFQSMCYCKRCITKST